MSDEYAIVDDNKFDRLTCNRIIRRVDNEFPVHEFEGGWSMLQFLQSAPNKGKDMFVSGC